MLHIHPNARTIPDVRGILYVQRQAQGFKIWSPQSEPRDTGGGPDSIGSVPANAAATALPGDGVLIAWTRAGSNGAQDSCAILHTYRDPVVPSSITAYRRSIQSQFCSAT